MAETYGVTLSVQVLKTSNKEVVVDESYMFNDQSFAKMANLSDEFYDLIAKLQKLK